jgi:hypothetical protein
MTEHKPELIFHSPESGDWLVVTDENRNGYEVYCGHGGRDVIHVLLEYLGVTAKHIEYTDSEFERKF